MSINTPVGLILVITFLVIIFGGEPDMVDVARQYLAGQCEFGQ